jgi:hypothetical protein
MIAGMGLEHSFFTKRHFLGYSLVHELMEILGLEQVKSLIQLAI